MTNDLSLFFPAFGRCARAAPTACAVANLWPGHYYIYIDIYGENMSKIALRKVGSSFVATIPVEVIKELHLEEGQKLQVGKENGRIVLTPVTAELDAVTAAHEKVLRKYRAAFQRLADV